MESEPRSWPLMDGPGQPAQDYGSQGHARYVPDGTVGQGLSRSLADRPASLPTWIAAHSGHGRASLIRMRSVVQVHLGPPSVTASPPSRQQAPRCARIHRGCRSGLVHVVAESGRTAGPTRRAAATAGVPVGMVPAAARAGDRAQVRLGSVVGHARHLCRVRMVEKHEIGDGYRPSRWSSRGPHLELLGGREVAALDNLMP
jgi:hypothetical protein